MDTIATTPLQASLISISGGRGEDPSGISGSVKHLVDIKTRLQKQTTLADSLTGDQTQAGLNEFLPGDGRRYKTILDNERTRLEALSATVDSLRIESTDSELPVVQKAENAWNGFVTSIKDLINHNKTEAANVLAA